MNNNSKLIAVAAVVVIIILALGGVFFLNQQTKSTSQTTTPTVSPPPTTQPTSSNSSLPNPASVNCANSGGQVVIKTRGDGGQYGVCDFGDNMQCEEWALMRGNCPKGGLKVTGFDTAAQIYCAISGGKTLAVADAKCTFSDGKVCGDEGYYNGKCSD